DFHVTGVQTCALPIYPILAVLWAVGISCAIGAAWQAKYHRFAALVLIGGAGLITCVTFIWFSAPVLAVTQLEVEIVTTVLILLEIGRASWRESVQRVV